MKAHLMTCIRGLPDAEIADMEGVLDEVEILPPVLGFDVLRPAGHEAGSSTANAAPTKIDESRNPGEVFTFLESGTNARARESTASSSSSQDRSLNGSKCKAATKN
ncbi:MAG: hypothetical protein WA397_11810 [Roseiarcus sp.]